MNHVNNAIAVYGLGMVSSLSNTAEGHAAIMRAGYSGSIETLFVDPYQPDLNLLGAPVETDMQKRGLSLFLEMMRGAISGATAVNDTKSATAVKLPIVLCMQEPARDNVLMSEHFSQAIFELFCEEFPQSSLSLFCGCENGRTSIVSGFSEAQKLLYKNDIERVLLLSIDSLLDVRSLSYYAGANIEERRLFGEDFPNGFIPGEAAVAILLGKPNGESQTCITGLGRATEGAPINSGEVLRGVGLTEAIRSAASDANIRVCDTDFRISSANGEEYWFRETSLAQSRTLEQKRENHPLWHPADCIGEVGAAVGGAMVVMGHYAFEKGYAPGNTALCQISNDDGARGAFIMQRMGGVEA